MPWRAAERRSSTASLPSRAAPLPSRSSRARLCLATGRLASTALRYHSMARVESRSTTKPRSYITATLNADCAEPSWAARNSQPAPACWSLVTPAPWIRRRARSSMAGISLALALARSSSIGIAAQSAGLEGSEADGEAVGGSALSAGSGGVDGCAAAIDAAGVAADRGVSTAAGFALSAVATLGSSDAGGFVSHAPVAVAATTRIAIPARRAGRFTRGSSPAASGLGSLSLPVILQP